MPIIYPPIYIHIIMDNIYICSNVIRMRVRCPPTVSTPWHGHREQVVHDDAHAKKINQVVLRTQDVGTIYNKYCVILYIHRAVRLYDDNARRCYAAGRWKTRQRISYNRMMISSYRGRCRPLSHATILYTSITGTRRPDDRMTGSSKITYRYQPKHRGFRAFLWIRLLFCRRLVCVLYSCRTIILCGNAMFRNRFTGRVVIISHSGHIANSNSTHIYKENRGHKKNIEKRKNWKNKRTSI